jgi:iron complex transport system permease protein
MNTSIIFMVIPLMVILSLVILFRHRIYNVMTLGAKQARGLGVDYERELHLNLILIAIGMSLATALIGSLTFLGLLAVNFSRMVLKTHRHLSLFLASGLVAALALLLGQTVVELLEGAIPVTVIINLVGCSYIFYYIIKDNKI